MKTRDEDNKQLKIDADLDAQEQEARRLAARENAKHILRESGLAEMLQAINKNLLKGRGHFEEYDSMILFRWGTQSTLRHMWIEVRDNTVRFRLQEHRKCTSPAPLCDGEYHTFTSAMWSNRLFLQSELKKYYDRPVAETSSD
ncbi:MAG TPA: hypothetical protein VGL94_16260 [Ktedonobacteraceae bacterium]|jgi:hypothetical protein